MKISSIDTTIKTIGKIIDWLPKIIELFKPFRPEITHFQINYKEMKAKLFYKLNVPPSSLRRTISKIKIPKLSTYKIENFFDEGFGNLNSLIKISPKSNEYVINPKDLPKCNFFQIVLYGNIDPKALQNLLRIQPAKNKDNTPTYDKYWLDVMIRDPTTLEQIYKSLEVNNINCSVRVSLEKSFEIELPKTLIDSAKATEELLSVAKTLDRQKVFRKWLKYYKSMKVNRDDIVKYFDNLLRERYLYDFIKVDEPFSVRDVKKPDTSDIIPSFFNVEAITDLTFQNPTASGYLYFHKKNFQKNIRNELKERWR